jgi:hypothetical protein
MSPEFWVLVGTLGGAVIGAAGASIPAYVAAKAETKRQRQRLAIDAGLREWKLMLDHTDAMAKAWPGRQFAVAPAFSFVLFYSRIAELLDEQRRLTPEAIEMLIRERDGFIEAGTRAEQPKDTHDHGERNV